MKRRSSTVVICITLLLAVVGKAEEKTDENDKTVESIYPGLVSGVLTFARLGELPEGVVLRAENVEITTGEIEKSIAEAPVAVQAQLKKNAFFLLEQVALEKLLLHVAEKDVAESKTDLGGKPDREIIQTYLEKVVKEIEVTNAEAKAFYEENKEMLGGAPFDRIKEQLRQYVLIQRREDAVMEHIRTLGNKIAIQVAASWLKEQAVLTKDNPVDKARASGKPSLVDFGATGCVSCDMMAPILDTLRTKYEGRLNVLFVHVREEQILTSRYGIRSIPVQVFFDKDGKEVFRHAGFLPQDEIEKKLSDIGVE